MISIKITPFPSQSITADDISQHSYKMLRY